MRLKIGFNTCLLLFLLLGLPACGPLDVAAPTPPAAVEGIVLLPFTSGEMGIAGLVPAGWVERVPGQFYRGAPPADHTLIVQRAVAGDTSAHLLQDLAAQLHLDHTPSCTGHVEGGHFKWDLYTMETSGAHGSKLLMDVALAETGEGVCLVSLMTLYEEHDNLYQAVFLPALYALAPFASLGDPQA